jgi:hypothetical protein
MRNWAEQHRWRERRKVAMNVEGGTPLELDHPLDPGIAPAVRALWAAGVETFESCDGGPGHAYAEPTVRFHGDRSEGLRALACAIQADLRPSELRRVWPILDGEATGPYWELTFPRC